MDPLTQGVLGACAAQGTAKREEIVLAGVAGVLGGWAADLDVFIRSDADPLLAIEFHRQFTHSLLFIPFGGFIVAGLMWLILRKWQVPFVRLYLFATVGYATHGLLDTCTSYGTMLLWPFTNARFAWHNIAIIDPIFTVALLLGFVLALFLKKRRWVVVPLSFALCYLLFGVLQRERAEAVIEQVAADRGHEHVRMKAKPNIGNNQVWRTIYEVDGKFFVDAVRVRWLGGTTFYEGTSIEKLDAATAFPELARDSTQYRDLLRFEWFSDAWIASYPDGDDIVVGDVRYGLLPNSVEPLWGIRMNPATPDQHVSYERFAGRNREKMMESIRFGFD